MTSSLCTQWQVNCPETMHNADWSLAECVTQLLSLLCNSLKLTKRCLRDLKHEAWRSKAPKCWAVEIPQIPIGRRVTIIDSNLLYSPINLASFSSYLTLLVSQVTVQASKNGWELKRKWLWYRIQRVLNSERVLRFLPHWIDHHHHPFQAKVPDLKVI